MEVWRARCEGLIVAATEDWTRGVERARFGEKDEGHRAQKQMYEYGIRTGDGRSRVRVYE